MEKISVCVPFYPWYRQHDRTEEIFEVMIPALVKAGVENFELCVVSGGTKDIWGLNRKRDPKEFEERLRRAWPGELKYLLTEKALTPHDHKMPNRFWVSSAINEAVRLASYDRIFILNIDIEVPENFAAQYQENVKPGRFWVARCYNIRPDMERRHEGGGWRSARGLVGMTKADYWAVGGTREQFVKDKHDTDLYLRLKAAIDCVEANCEGLYHIDHPGTNEGTSQFKGTWPRTPITAPKADLMIVCAHPDDEGIFFGGAAAYYSQVRQKAVVVVCATAVEGSRRAKELQDACKVYGCRIEPVFLGLKDSNERDKPLGGGREIINLDRAWAAWGGRENAIRLVVEQIRKYRPEVVLCHDTGGEGYHSNHATAAFATIDACMDAADCYKYRESLQNYCVWSVKKLYCHMHEINMVRHEWNMACLEMGGHTPEYITNQGLACHVSQGRHVVHPSADRWGLYGTRVGPDKVKLNDFFENVGAK